MIRRSGPRVGAHARPMTMSLPIHATGCQRFGGSPNRRSRASASSGVATIVIRGPGLGIQTANPEPRIPNPENGFERRPDAAIFFGSPHRDAEERGAEAGERGAVSNRDPFFDEPGPECWRIEIGCEELHQEVVRTSREDFERRKFAELIAKLLAPLAEERDGRLGILGIL